MSDVTLGEIAIFIAWSRIEEYGPFDRYAIFTGENLMKISYELWFAHNYELRLNNFQNTIFFVVLWNVKT